MFDHSFIIQARAQTNWLTFPGIYPKTIILIFCTLFDKKIHNQRHIVHTIMKLNQLDRKFPFISQQRATF